MKSFALATLLLAGALPVHANIVTFEVTTLVSEIREAVSHGAPAVTPITPVTDTLLTPAKVSVGDKLVTRISYDTAWYPDYVGSSGATYSSTALAAFPAAALTFANGLQVMSTSQHAHVDVYNDSYDALNLTASFSPLSALSFRLYDASANALSSTALPTYLNASQFAFKEMNLFWNNANNDIAMIDGNILSITQLSPVPEPASYSMLLAGMAVVGYALRRRQA